MELSALTLRVLLLFFPGVLCAMLVDALTVHRERTPTQFLTNAFVLGFASYLLLYSGQWVCEGAANLLGVRPPRRVTFMDALMNDRLRIAWGEIVLAAGTGIVLGVAVSAGLNHKVLYRMGGRLHVTRRRGTIDLWSYVLDSPQTTWISARDLEHGFTYLGWVQSYSETAAMAELWLRNVTVYQSASGTKLYDADALYLCQDPRSMTIEVLPIELREGADDGGKDVRAVGAKQVQPEWVQSRPDYSAAGLQPGPAPATGRARRGARKAR